MSELLPAEKMSMPEIEIINNKVMIFNEVDSILEQIKEEAEEVGQLDVWTKEGYKEIKTFANKLVKLRTSTEKKGKDAVEPFVDITNLIRSESKRIQDELKSIESPLKTAYKAVDDEKKRQEAEKDRFLRDCLQWIQDAPNRMIGKSSEAITAEIDKLADTDLGSNWEGYLDLASNALTTSLNMLSQLQTMALSQEQIKQQKEDIREAAESPHKDHGGKVHVDENHNFSYYDTPKKLHSIAYATKEDLIKSIIDTFEGIEFVDGEYKITIEQV